MEQFSDLIKNRRSMRKFTDQELTQEEVVALLKAALMAPSSKRSNCWQFIVVDDKDMLEKLSHCKEMGAAFLADAAMAVVVMADPLASDVWIEDASIVVGYRCVNVLPLPGCPRVNTCIRCLIFRCSCRWFPL